MPKFNSEKSLKSRTDVEFFVQNQYVIESSAVGAVWLGGRGVVKNGNFPFFWKIAFVAYENSAARNFFSHAPPSRYNFLPMVMAKSNQQKRKKKQTNNKMTISLQGNSRVNDDGKYGNVLKL